MPPRDLSLRFRSVEPSQCLVRKASETKMTKLSNTLFIAGALSFSLSTLALAHDHHANKGGSGKLLTGQGDLVFSFDKALPSKFPDAAKSHEKKMHGGFTEDPRTGIVYTGIPGYGLCSISADLKEWKKLGKDKRLTGTIHGQVFFIHNKVARLALAQPSDKRILITDLSGKILQEIRTPTGTEFDFKPANEFYAKDQKGFKVTDLTYLKGKLYAVTGYSKGDFVLTLEEQNGKWAWAKLAWGGRGKNPGQFQTAHEVYAHEGYIYVANRAAFQVVKFTKDGKFLGMLNEIPTGSKICNVSFLKGHFFFNALSRVAKTSSAPIYAHSGTGLASTIIPGDLKVPVLNMKWPGNTGHRIL